MVLERQDGGNELSWRRDRQEEGSFGTKSSYTHSRRATSPRSNFKLQASPAMHMPHPEQLLSVSFTTQATYYTSTGSHDIIG